MHLPPGFRARAAQRPDLPDLHRVVAAYEHRLLGEVMVELEDLEADWRRPSFDPARDSLVVLRDDDVVGCAELYRGRRAAGCVHPDSWGLGIGAALVDWSIARAGELGATVIGQTVPDADSAAADLFRGRGWCPRWTSWVLEVPPGSAIAERPLPPGYAVRPLRPGQDERAAYEVVESAFSEWPDREPTSYEDWAATLLERPGFEPWQLLLAVAGDGAVVGACHLVVSDGTGWVNQLAVDRSHRGQGLAQALLAQAFGAARERGAERGELSTDSRTGALTLYERLGMRVKWSFTHHAGKPTVGAR